MDYLQYSNELRLKSVVIGVLNLVINGLPSIQKTSATEIRNTLIVGFKPCYKWITFNTNSEQSKQMKKR